MTRSPISACVIVAPAPIAHSRPIQTSGPITAPSGDHVSAPIWARGPITASGSMVTLISIRRCGAHAPPWRGRLLRTATTAAACRETARARPRQRPHRAAASPAPQGRAERRPQTAARSGKRRRACRPIRRDIWNFEKAHVGCGCGIERRNIADAPVGRIAVAQPGARQRGDLAGRQFAVRFDKIRHTRP